MAKLATLGRLLVPEGTVHDMKPSPAFVKRLQSAFDRDLHVTWHVKKQRFVIEQCVEHHSGQALNSDGVLVHDHTCRRIYVWLVQGEQEDYMPLGDSVIAHLQEMETYRRYGTGPAALERFRQESASFDREQERKRKEEAHSVFQYLKRHNRIVRNKLKLMMQKHDWTRVNK
jgi:hypothetical protein